MASRIARKKLSTRITRNIMIYLQENDFPVKKIDSQNINDMVYDEITKEVRDYDMF